jgi:hypothetical protein
MILVLILILAFPIVFLVKVQVDNLRVASDQLRAGGLVMPPPPQGIKNWTLIDAPEKVWSTPEKILRWPCNNLYCNCKSW